MSHLFKPISVSKIDLVSMSLLFMFTQFNSSRKLSQSPKFGNNLEFNKTAFMAFVASNNKSVDYNLLPKRIGHPTIHALNHIMRC